MKPYRCKAFIGFYSVLKETFGRLLSVFNRKAKSSLEAEDEAPLKAGQVG